METQRFWNEEMRSFPHGGQGAVVWIVRQDGCDLTAPVNLLFSWAQGPQRMMGLIERPPLGTFIKAMSAGQAELVHRQGDAALWIEPLECTGRVRGCLGILFDAPEPFREAIFLWGQKLAAHLGPVLGQLEPLQNRASQCPTLVQPTLFPLPPVPGQAAVSAPPGRGGRRRQRDLPLPRPTIVRGIPGCVGISREMQTLGAGLADVARSNVNVLLQGESGTGKEIIAKALHVCSDRKSGPFVGQNCAALPETLFESELFGHRSGAFTGATGDKKGLLASANGGTFFLDEIGDMPMALQIKLLRVMQERRLRRIGELHSRAVDLRFVAATHKDLRQEILQGRFRLDLFYRLKVVSLVIPPLRHRPEDILPLFSYFLKNAGRDPSRIRMSESALACLQAWRWPGNVRELENEVRRFVALHPNDDRIDLGRLSPEIQNARGARIEPEDLGTLRNLGEATEILERYLIRKAIAATEGRKAAAARRLGLSRQGLYKKIQRYGMVDLVSTELVTGEAG